MPIDNHCPKLIRISRNISVLELCENPLLPGIKQFTVNTNSPVDFRLLACKSLKNSSPNECGTHKNPNNPKNIACGDIKKYASLYYRTESKKSKIKHYLMIFVNNTQLLSKKDVDIIEALERTAVWLEINNEKIFFEIVGYGQIFNEVGNLNTHADYSERLKARFPNMYGKEEVICKIHYVHTADTDGVIAFKDSNNGARIEISL